MDYIRVLAPIINEKEITIPFQCSAKPGKYFSSFQFAISYSEDIRNVPESIAVIPFICNVLPIVWLTNSTLEVECLDKDFFDSIQEFKKGYVNMYPQLDFKGELKVQTLIKNEGITTQPQTATFFSGGVDAFATLIAHLHENPTLLTVRGADISLDDHTGWNNVTKHVEETCNELKCNPIYISSNFRLFLNYKLLTQLVIKSKDGWWHGFQHGIGLLGLAAPIAYKKGFTTIYIASSYTATDQVTCASHPSIDNFVRYCSCQIKHDQYECTRQNKITHICDFVRRSKNAISLRVCWKSSGGKNCGFCEKCIRTIYGILAEGENPENMGFPNISKHYVDIKEQIQKRIIFDFTSIPFWLDIQKRFIENQKKLSYGPDINWIYTYDFTKANHTAWKQTRIVYKRIRKCLGNIKRALFN